MKLFDKYTARPPICAGLGWGDSMGNKKQPARAMVYWFSLVVAERGAKGGV